MLILFESHGYQLTSVRAVMIDSNLNIAVEENWANSIAANESIIADNIEEMNAPANNPNHGLRLTSKAAARKKSRLHRKLHEEEDLK